ncbi:MAG: hypothetical protein ABI867_00545 [Kofleriaceae bacterium]
MGSTASKPPPGSAVHAVAKSFAVWRDGRWQCVYAQVTMIP